MFVFDENFVKYLDKTRLIHFFGYKKLEIPEPEFYVIFTGNHKFTKDTIPLKDDFWNNSNAKVDVVAKVIYAENKENIIVQYIIFSHVMYEQIRK